MDLGPLGTGFSSDGNHRIVFRARASLRSIDENAGVHLTQTRGGGQGYPAACWNAHWCLHHGLPRFDDDPNKRDPTVQAPVGVLVEIPRRDGRRKHVQSLLESPKSRIRRDPAPGRFFAVTARCGYRPPFIWGTMSSSAILRKTSWSRTRSARRWKPTACAAGSLRATSFRARVGRARILKGIASCRAMVLVFSGHANTSAQTAIRLQLERKQ